MVALEKYEDAFYFNYAPLSDNYRHLPDFTKVIYFVQ